MKNGFTLHISFPTAEASPPEMEEFYESLSPTLREDKWFFQEYGIRGKHKAVRTIGFSDLTPLQVTTVTTKAKKYLPKVKVTKHKSC